MRREVADTCNLSLCDIICFLPAEFLPDYDALLLGQVHRAVGDTECLVEALDIAQSDIYTILAQ